MVVEKCLYPTKKKSEFKRRYFASGEDHEQHIVTGGGSCDRIDELKEN